MHQNEINSELIELGAIQKGIFIECSMGNRVAYNILLTLEVKPLNAEILKNAVNFAVSEEEAFHYGVRLIDNSIYYQLQKNIEIPFEVVKCKTMSETKAEAKKTFGQPFDLANPPLVRIKYINLLNKNFLLVCLHHLIADGISVQIFVNKLFDWYNKLLNQEDFILSSNQQGGFFSFVKRENKRLKTGKYNTQKEFWENNIRTAKIPNLIPEFNQNKESDDLNHLFSEVHIPVSKNILSSLDALTKEIESSEFSILAAAYAATLMRMTGDTDFAFASPFMNRPREKDENCVGCYIYNYPLCCHSLFSDEVIDLIAEMQTGVLNGYKYMGYPSSLIVRSESEDGPLSKTYADYNFIYDSYEKPESDLVLGIKEWDFCACPGEMTVIYQKIEDSAVIKIQYNNSLFSEKYMETFGKRIINILGQICKCPKVKISELDILLENEKDDLLSWELESRFFDYKEECIIDIFEKKVSRCANEIAIVSKTESWTYSEVEKMANAVANRLTNFSNIDTQNIAAIFMERSIFMVVSVLGVLKAGWAYVPLGINYTVERIQYIERDTSVSAFLVSSNTNSLLQGVVDATILNVESLLEESKDISFSGIARRPEDLAYIEYTSGSTGEPKGVMIENRSIVNTVRDLDRRFPLGKEDCYLFKTSLSFDISGTEIYGWIIGEGKLCILGPDEEKDVYAIADIIEKCHVTHVNFVPSMLSIFVNAVNNSKLGNKLSSLKWVFTGGEAINHSLVDSYKMLNIDANLENVYGPTEATMWATHYPIRNNNKTLNVLIGKPLNEYRLYVVDPLGNRLPAMCVGELCISGAGLARGYLNKPELTKKVFVSNPFFRDNDLTIYQKMYKTGDLARLHFDGNIEFLGRNDGQVKINGIRIELGEIENVYSTMKGINECISMVRQRESGEKYIVLCYSSKEPKTEQELIEFASQKLPLPLIPRDYFWTERFPRTVSEKIDRKKLKALFDSRPDKNIQTSNETLTKMEQIIISIWSKVLDNKKNIHRNDSFFSIGGSSVTLVNVHNLLINELGVTIPITTLLSNPTVGELAKALDLLINNKRKDSITDLFEEETSVKINRLDEIAIVGMAVDVPGAQTLHDFWDNLLNAKDCIHEYSKEELRELGIGEELINNPNYVPRKGRIENLDYFDSEFFGVTPGEVSMMSPQLRVLYKGVWKALEDAGLTDGKYNPTTGVFIGGSDDFLWYKNKLFSNDIYSDTYQVYTNSTNHFLATRLSYMFDFNGPSMEILTGCSTSLVTVHYACNALKLGECDVAIAGGVTVELPNEGGYMYEPNMMFSNDGKCRPFDDNANGTMFSNGMGLVVLKRLSDALKDNNHIYAVIKGSAVRNDGRSKLSFTAPGSKGQILTIKEAYKKSGIDPDTVTFIEAHGTGTKLGDPIEVASLTEVFGNDNSNLCVLGSVKGNIGHTDTAAGIVGLIKTAMCLEHKYIPATVSYQTPNKNIDFTSTRFKVFNHGIVWKKGKYKGPLRAGVNAFGVGGTNAHVILEEFEEG